MPYRIAAYRDFIDPPLLEALRGRCVSVPEVPGLGVARGLRSQFPSLSPQRVSAPITMELLERHTAATKRSFDIITIIPYKHSKLFTFD